jgi:diadenylate cyclase
MIPIKLIPKIKMVAPGTLLRRALDDILKADFGALLVFLDDIKEQENVIEGGFYIGTNFSPEKLYELAKMDGAIILDESVSRILAANVQLTPDPGLPTNETGMRHRAAERMARQTGKFVVTISRRRHVITLYFGDQKHQIDDFNQLFARVNQTITTLERYKKNLDDMVLEIDAAEFENRVEMIAVIEIIRKAREIVKLRNDIAPFVIEAGVEGRLAAMQLQALTEDVHTLVKLFIMDYCADAMPEHQAEQILQRLVEMDDVDDGSIAAELGWNLKSEMDMHEVRVLPRGYRLLKYVAKIPMNTSQNVVRRFKDFPHLIQIDGDSLMEVDGVGEKRAKSIIDGINYVRRRLA